METEGIQQLKAFILWVSSLNENVVYGVLVLAFVAFLLWAKGKGNGKRF